jgi:hypothetical protein
MPSIAQLRSALGSFADDKNDEQLLQAVAEAKGQSVNDVAGRYGYNPTSSGPTAKRFGASADQYQAGLYGLGEAVTGADFFKRNRIANEFSANVAMERAANQGAINSFEQVQGVGDLPSYVGGLAIQSLPYVGEALVGGLAARGLMSGTRAAATAARAAGDTGALTAATRQLGAGQIGGAVTAAYPSSVADILQNQREQAGTTDLGSAALYGIPYAALNALGETGVIARGGVARGGMAALDNLQGFTGGLTRAGYNAGRIALEESIGETGQEMLNQRGRMAVDPNAQFLSPEALARYKESAIGGAFLGGAVGGAAGGWRRTQEGGFDLTQRDSNAPPPAPQQYGLITEPAPLQQRIDEQLGIGLRTTPKDYAKQFEAAYNEPSGQYANNPVTGLERQLSVGEYLQSSSAPLDLTAPTLVSAGATPGATTPSIFSKTDEDLNALSIKPTKKSRNIYNYMVNKGIDPTSEEAEPILNALYENKFKFATDAIGAIIRARSPRGTSTTPTAGTPASVGTGAPVVQGNLAPSGSIAPVVGTVGGNAPGVDASNAQTSISTTPPGQSVTPIVTATGTPSGDQTSETVETETKGQQTSATSGTTTATAAPVTKTVNGKNIRVVPIKTANVVAPGRVVAPGSLGAAVTDKKIVSSSGNQMGMSPADNFEIAQIRNEVQTILANTFGERDAAIIYDGLAEKLDQADIGTQTGLSRGRISQLLNKKGIKEKLDAKTESRLRNLLEKLTVSSNMAVKAFDESVVDRDLEGAGLAVVNSQGGSQSNYLDRTEKGVKLKTKEAADELEGLRDQLSVAEKSDDVETVEKLQTKINEIEAKYTSPEDRIAGKTQLAYEQAQAADALEAKIAVAEKAGQTTVSLKNAKVSLDDARGMVEELRIKVNDELDKTAALLSALKAAPSEVKPEVAAAQATAAEARKRWNDAGRDLTKLDTSDLQVLRTYTQSIKNLELSGKIATELQSRGETVGATNAVSEPSATSVPVQEQPKGGGEVRQGNAQGGQTTTARKTKAAPAETQVKSSEEQWNDLAKTFPQMPAYETLSADEKTRWADVAQRGVANLAAANTILSATIKAAPAEKVATPAATGTTETVEVITPAAVEAHVEQTVDEVVADNPEATQINPEQQAILEQPLAALPEPQVQRLENHYNAKRGTSDFFTKLQNDVTAYATKGAQAVSGVIRDIIKAIHTGVLAVAMVFNPSVMTQNSEVIVVTPQIVSTTTQVKATIPAAAKANMSTAAQEAYQTLYPAIKDRLIAENKFMVITDKPNARLFIFNPNGSLFLQKKVLVGRTIGDFYKGNTDKVENRITPAGLFTLGLRDATRSANEKRTAGEYDFGKVFVLDKAIDGEYSVTLFHSVWTNEKDAAQRLEALKKEGAADSRYSFGCINVDKATFGSLVANNLNQMDGAALFVVPDKQELIGEFLTGDVAKNKAGKDELTRTTFTPKTETTTRTDVQKNATNVAGGRTLTGKEEKFQFGVDGVAKNPFPNSVVTNPVYHATQNQFRVNDFKTGDIGIHFGDMRQAADRGGLMLEAEVFGRMGADTSASEIRRNFETAQNGPLDSQRGNRRMIKVFLDIKNPIQMKEPEGGGWHRPEALRDALKAAGIVLPKALDNFITGYAMSAPSARSGLGMLPAQRNVLDLIVKALKAQGYDGVIYKNKYEGKVSDRLFNPRQSSDPWFGKNSYIVFDNSQISAPEYDLAYGVNSEIHTEAPYLKADGHVLHLMVNDKIAKTFELVSQGLWNAFKGKPDAQENLLRNKDALEISDLAQTELRRAEYTHREFAPLSRMEQGAIKAINENNQEDIFLYNEGAKNMAVRRSIATLIFQAFLENGKPLPKSTLTDLVASGNTRGVSTILKYAPASMLEGVTIPKFGVNSVAKNPYTAAELTKDIQEFIRADILGSKLIIVDNLQALLESPLQDLKALATAIGDKGAYGVAVDGKAYLIANRIEKGDGRAKFMHEVGAHLGLENLLPKVLFNRLTSQIEAWAKTDNGSVESKIAKAAQIRVEAANTPAADRLSELLAYFVEEAVQAGIDPTAAGKESAALQSWFRTLWAAFKVAIRRLGFKTGAVTAQDVVNLAFGAARLEITGTWHGTAADFRKFSHAFMNSGEGAQAFGWGTYLAQAKAVGEKYFLDDVFRKGGTLNIEPRFSKFTGTQYFVSNANGTWVDRFDNLKDAETFVKQKSTEGSLMRVDTSVSNDEMINWDAPIADQPQLVKEFFKQVQFGGLQIKTGGDVYKALLAKFYKEAGNTSRWDDASKKTKLEIKKTTSQYLDAYGIKGHVFLDEGSRENTFNNTDFTKGNTTLSGIESLINAYFTPGEIVNGYGGADKVISFNPTNNDVKVISVDTDGNPRRGERERVHFTMPSFKELSATLQKRGYTAKPSNRTRNVVIYNDKNIFRIGSETAADRQRMKFGVNAPPTQSFVQQTIAALPKVLQQPVRNSIGVIRDVTGKYLDYAVFTGDLVNRAVAAGLPSAKDFVQTIALSKAKAREAEQVVEKIADMYALVPDKDRGTGPASVNQFLFDSTRESKWGYGKYRDDVMGDRFDKLSDEAKDFVKAVFDHGATVLAQKKKVVLDSAVTEYDAMIKAAQDAGDLVVKAKLESEKAATLKRFQTLFKVREGLPYAPIKRTGSNAVIAKSAEYIQAELAKNTKRIKELESDSDHYHVSFTDGKWDARTLQSQLQDQGFFQDVQILERDDAVNSLYGGASALRELASMRSRVEAAAAAGDKSSSKLLGVISQMYLEALAENSARKSEMRRRGVAGEVDMVQSFAQQGRADAQFMASVQYNPQVQDSLQKMRNDAKTGNRERKSEIFNELSRRYIQSMDYHQNPWTNKLTRVSSLYFLATSPAYYLQNLTQPWIMTVPSMAGRHGYTEASGALFKAYTELGDVMKGSKLLKQQFDFSKVPADVRDAIKELVNRGKIDIGLDSEIGEFRVEGEGYVREKLNSVDKAMRLAVQKVESINRLSSGIAAYRLELAKTNDKTKALDYADQILTDTHGDYTAFNAPRAFNNPVGKVMLQFRKFQLIQLAFHAKLIKDALQGRERAAALKALGYSLSHTAALAGVMGLPGYSAIAWAIGKMFSDEDDKYDVEEEIRKAIGDEGTSNLVLRGAPTIAGIDISGKVGAGNMLSVLPFNNADVTTKAGLAQTFGTLVGGASLGMIANQVDGLGLMMSGDWYKGLERMMPKGVGDAMKAYRISTEGMTRRNGDVVLPPEEVSGVDTALQAIGISPSEQTRVYERQQVIRDQDQRFKDRAQQITKDYVRAMREGDSEDAAKAREAWMKLQQVRMEKGYTRQPLSTLLKAPQAQRQREKDTAGGVQFTKANKRAVMEEAEL